MADNRPYPDRGPQRPATEPEIIPPGQDDRARGPMGIWMRIDEREGVRRVYVARPSLGSLLLGIFIVGLIAALAFLAMAGLLLVWMPILIGGILLAMLSSKIRRRWRAP
jgi:hypothetical protein